MIAMITIGSRQRSMQALCIGLPFALNTALHAHGVWLHVNTPPLTRSVYVRHAELPLSATRALLLIAAHAMSCAVELALLFAIVRKCATVWPHQWCCKQVIALYKPLTVSKPAVATAAVAVTASVAFAAVAAWLDLRWRLVAGTPISCAAVSGLLFAQDTHTYLMAVTHNLSTQELVITPLAPLAVVLACVVQPWLSALWALRSAARPRSRHRHSNYCLTMSALGLVVLALACSPTLELHVGPCTSLARATVQAAMHSPPHGKRTAGAARGHKPLNTLLLVMESVGAHEIIRRADEWPRLHSWSKQPGVYNFSSATSHATVTEVAAATLFQGISPEQPELAFRATPLVWERAAAAGRHTFVYRSHVAPKVANNNLHRFYPPPETLDRFVDHHDVNSYPRQGCIDDRDMVALFLEDLRAGVLQEPWFGTLHFCVAHGEFMGFPGTQGTTAAGGPRTDMWWQDKLVHDIVQELRDVSLLDHTAIVLTADHAGEALPEPGVTPIDWKRCSVRECSTKCPCPARFASDPFVEQGRISRVTSGYLAIPLFLYIPPAYTSHVGPHLKHNTRQLVGGVDIVPTLVDLWGLSTTSASTAVPQQNSELSGHSLLRPLPRNRSLIALNTGMLRPWRYEPFAVLSDTQALFFDAITGLVALSPIDSNAGALALAKAYNFRRSNSNQWTSLTASERNRWLARLMTVPYIRRVLWWRAPSNP